MRKMYTLQRGFAAISAVFLMVVLAALGAFMLTFSNTQQLTSVQDISGSKAYWAARGGLEWGLASASAAAACPATATLAIDGFSVSVGCASQMYVEAGASRTIFRITATASAGVTAGSVGYTERSVSATLEL